VLAEVFEQDLALVRTGQAARFAPSAWPERSFTGRVAFVYPTVDPATRTARVRMELPNPGLVLKPAMYGTVELAARAPAPVLAIPDSAVLDSGTRQAVLVRRGEGLFEPRTVKLGMRADGYIEVLEGLAAGEEVVVRANFLIDAESNLRAAFESFGGRAAPAAALHKGTGRVEAVDAAAGTVEIAHAPIPSLGWPAMTMEFKVRDKAMLAGLRKGQSVEIEIAPAAPGEYVIERMRAAPAPAAHKGH
jgi:Cu(I)/Ag(I) efflux system membrane fusion protein